MYDKIYTFSKGFVEYIPIAKFRLSNSCPMGQNRKFCVMHFAGKFYFLGLLFISKHNICTYEKKKGKGMKSLQ